MALNAALGPSPRSWHRCFLLLGKQRESDARLVEKSLGHNGLK